MELEDKLTIGVWVIAILVPVLCLALFGWRAMLAGYVIFAAIKLILWIHREAKPDDD